MNQATDIKAFVPAREFELSAQFYGALGFTMDFQNEQLMQFSCGDCRFLLQNFYNQELAENLMMQLIVPSCDEWWQHIETLDLPQFNGARAKAPEMQPWGQKVLYLWDPTGVLWHIAEEIR